MPQIMTLSCWAKALAISEVSLNQSWVYTIISHASCTFQKLLHATKLPYINSAARMQNQLVCRLGSFATSSAVWLNSQPAWAWCDPKPESVPMMYPHVSYPLLYPHLCQFSSQYLLMYQYQYLYPSVLVVSKPVPVPIFAPVLIPALAS